MTLELLMDLKIFSPRFRDYLTIYEAMRGESNKFAVTITNKGKSIFPGGAYEYVKIQYSTTAGFGTTTQTWNFQACPPLEPNAQEPLTFDFVPHNDGMGWLYLKITPPAGEKIDYYATGYSTPVSDEWRSPFYIVNKEQLHIISLLELTNKKLDALLTRRKSKST